MPTKKKKGTKKKKAQAKEAEPEPIQDQNNENQQNAANIQLPSEDPKIPDAGNKSAIGSPKGAQKSRFFAESQKNLPTEPGTPAKSQMGGDHTEDHLHTAPDQPTTRTQNHLTLPPIRQAPPLQPQRPELSNPTLVIPQNRNQTMIQQPGGLSQQRQQQPQNGQFIPNQPNRLNNQPLGQQPSKMMHSMSSDRIGFPNSSYLPQNQQPYSNSAPKKAGPYFFANNSMNPPQNSFNQFQHQHSMSLQNPRQFHSFGPGNLSNLGGFNHYSNSPIKPRAMQKQSPQNQQFQFGLPPPHVLFPKMFKQKRKTVKRLPSLLESKIEQQNDMLSKMIGLMAQQHSQAQFQPYSQPIHSLEEQIRSLETKRAELELLKGYNSRFKSDESQDSNDKKNKKGNMKDMMQQALFKQILEGNDSDDDDDDKRRKKKKHAKHPPGMHPQYGPMDPYGGNYMHPAHQQQQHNMGKYAHPRSKKTLPGGVITPKARKKPILKPRDADSDEDEVGGAKSGVTSMAQSRVLDNIPSKTSLDGDDENDE